MWFSSLTVLIALGCALSANSFVPAPAKAAQPKLVALLGNPTAAAARQDFLSQLSKSSKRSANLEYRTDPLFNQALKHEVMVDTQVSAGFWASIRPIDQKVKIYIAQSNNLQYIYKYMKKNKYKGQKITISN